MIETVYLMSDREIDVVDNTLKDKIKNVLDVPGDLQVVDFGQHSLFAAKPLLSKLVAEDENSVAISFSNDIIKYSMAFNKKDYVRAIPAFNKSLVEKARKELDVNILCVSYTLFTFEDNRDMIKAFINTKYEEDIETFMNLISIGDI